MRPSRPEPGCRPISAMARPRCCPGTRISSGRSWPAIGSMPVSSPTVSICRPIRSRRCCARRGLSASYLVSDTAALAGMPPGVYDQPIGGRVEVGSDGRLSVAGTPYLAGAGRPLCEDVALAIRMADLTLADGVRLATVNPGRFVGGRGRLAVGEMADLMLFDWEQDAASLTIRETYVAGEECSSGLIVGSQHSRVQLDAQPVAPQIGRLRLDRRDRTLAIFATAREGDHHGQDLFRDAQASFIAGPQAAPSCRVSRRRRASCRHQRSAGAEADGVERLSRDGAVLPPRRRQHEGKISKTRGLGRGYPAARA